MARYKIEVTIEDDADEQQNISDHIEYILSTDLDYDVRSIEVYEVTHFGD